MAALLSKAARPQAPQMCPSAWLSSAPPLDSSTSTGALSLHSWL